MIPTSVLVDDSTSIAGIPADVELSQLTIPGGQVVLWNGHEFEATKGNVGRYPDGRVGIDFHDLDAGEREATMRFYYPIDPRMDEVDVAGATIAYPNDDNTGWLFAHCDNDAMVDWEQELAAAVVARFAAAIDQAQIKVNEATNTVAEAQAVANHRSLVSFRNSAIIAVTQWARTRHIGWQEQHPHEAHVHLPVLRAVEVVAANWRRDNAVSWSRVSTRVSAIIKDLAKPHAYETRWDKAARIAAEAKAKADAEASAETDTEES
ncbi:MAG: hypothetical protein OXC11_16500 [Rhodospirillales bacterium]|nr:hypothetical protein [Rhodospirillales bacterium]